jgi:hypothetical protein
MKNNFNNNNKRKRNKRKRNRKPNKRNISTPINVMRATAPVQLQIGIGVDPSQVSQNHAIPIMEILYTSTVWEHFSELYQYFKLAFVEIKFRPNIVYGLRPPPGYMILQGNEEQEVQYSRIPDLPGAKMIRNGTLTSYKFTRPGKNPDFNYWYNTTGTEKSKADAAIRVRFLKDFVQPNFLDQGPVSNCGYFIELKYHLKFSNMIIQARSTEAVGIDGAQKEKVQKVNKIVNEKSSMSKPDDETQV